MIVFAANAAQTSVVSNSTKVIYSLGERLMDREKLGAKGCTRIESWVLMATVQATNTPLSPSYMSGHHQKYNSDICVDKLFMKAFKMNNRAIKETGSERARDVRAMSVMQTP